MKKTYIVVIVVAVIAMVGGLIWWQVSTPTTIQPSTVAPGISSATTPPTPSTPTPQQPAANPPATPTPAAAPVTMVELKRNPMLGFYLTDNNGRALYVFAKDADGKGTCTGTCATLWPAFDLAKVTIGPGLDMGDFSTTVRADGTSQTTYYGWPLYYYSGDIKSGDVNGEGIGKLWYVAKPDYTVVFANKNNVSYLIDAETGHTLYTLSNDKPNVSNCAGQCATNWPIFSVDKIVAPSFIDAARLANFVRPDKKSQTTFDQKPLYHFFQDKVRGDMNGQGFGGLWSTVDPFSVKPTR